MDVVIRRNLCDGEKQFIMERQIIVQSALKRHGIVVPDVKNVPRVALLGSGGGQRAHTSFLGVIQQLKKEDILDCFHYLAGVSGSTWSMSSLYQNPTWSLDAVKTTQEALSSMSEGTGPTIHKAVEWFKGREKDGNFSLSDVWGVITCTIKGVSLETKPLRDDKDNSGTNPYPLFSTVERFCLDLKKTKEIWFEFSPHESGFLQHGAYVDTSLLNKKFDKGHVKSPPKKQVDMVQLQGMCGCAMGDLDEIKNYIWNWIVEWVRKMIFGSNQLDHYQDFSPSLKGVDDESWRNMNDQDKRKFVEKLCDELAASANKWGQGTLDKSNSNSILDDVLWLYEQIKLMLASWEFGTMPNFLYRFSDPAIPEDMTVNPQLHLIDAAFHLNSPYPSVLRDARDISLIISFDFSDGDPFETLRVASEYAAATGHPFPKVDFTKLDPNQPRSYYVFEEKCKPTVIHIPLFNMDNCKNQETIELEKKKYQTFQMPYLNKAKIDHLAHLAGLNVSMNRDKILKEINKAGQRRSAH